MDCHCVSSTTFDEIERTFRRTMFPHLKIKFNFSFHTEYSNYSANKDSPTGPQFLGSLPSSNHITAAQVTVKNSLSDDEVREVLEKALGNRLPDDERQYVINRVWTEVVKSFPDKTLHKYTILTLDFKIQIKHWHVYAVESDDPRMVPVADTCCICLEELADCDAALRMPCSHVFHGGCIEEWLKRSHNCPLCRSEVPSSHGVDI